MDDAQKFIERRGIAIEDALVGQNVAALKSQNTVELTSKELMENNKIQFESSTWAKHQSAVAVNRLEQEAEDMRKDLNQRRDRLARVEAQIYHINYGGDDKLDGHMKERHETLRSHLLWIIAGVITGVLKLSFCVVFGSLIHEAAPTLLSDSISVGVGVQLVSAFVPGLITAMYSTVGVSIPGPDIIQALMLANMAKVIEKDMDDKDAALATILFLSVFSTLLIALTWLVIVRYHLMVVLDFFPVSVVTGFLGCIGYKVVEEAIHIAVGKYWYEPWDFDFWKLFLPILPLGLPLFLLKRFHIGSLSSFFHFLWSLPLLCFLLSSIVRDRI